MAQASLAMLFNLKCKEKLYGGQRKQFPYRLKSVESFLASRMKTENLESFLVDRRKSIIRMHHDIASYLDSSNLGEDFLEKSTKRVLKEACETLGFSQGEIYLLLDKEGNIPNIGTVESTWKIAKPIVAIGMEKNEEDNQEFIRTREWIEDPKNRGPIYYIIYKGDTLQLYRNKEYIKGLEDKEILRKEFWEEYLEEPTTEDTRNVLIRITRNITSGFEVPGFANFSIPNYPIREDEAVSDILVGVAKEVIDGVTDYLIQFGLLDKLQKSIQERERLASIAAIGTFAGHHSHTIKNQATKVKANLDLIIEDLRDGDIKKALQRAEACKRANQELNKLTEQIATIAHPGGDYSRRNIHVGLESILELERGTFDGRINWYFDDTIPEVYHNTSGLSQVFINLMSNANRATRQKKELCEKNSTPYRREIRVRTKNLKDKLEIEFYDNGVGIKKEDLKRVYDVTFTTKPKSEGVGGYGLSTSYKIIKEHNGDIIIESKEGEYTKVIVSLPIN